MSRLVVKLKDYEFREIAQNGLERAINAIDTQASLQAPMLVPRDKYYFEDNIKAAIAEYGVCLAYGFEYQWEIGQAWLNRPDAGPLEVRTVSYDGAGLIVKPKDVDHQRIVLTRVNPRLRSVYLYGWATAAQIRQHGKPGRYSKCELAQELLEDMADIGLEPTARVRRMVVV